MKHTVLLVEDELDIREMLTEALETSGYEVVAATDGQDAIDRLHSIEHVCLVLLDLEMPRMNGWDFYARLREQPSYAMTPVIVHSSNARDVPAGVTRVIRKPMPFDRLLSVAKEFCAS